MKLNGLGWSISESVWQGSWRTIDEELTERLLRHKVRRRVYLGRYMPGATMDWWDRRTSDEVQLYFEELDRLIKRENGDDVSDE